MSKRLSITHQRPDESSDADLLRSISPLRHQLESKRELIRQLEIASSAMDEDEQGAALYAIVAIVQWLDADPRTAVVSAPLGRLAGALKDAIGGAKPALFKAKIKSSGGRPSNLSFDMVRGTAAAGLDTLIRAGEQDEQAADLIAGELNRLGILLPNGASITAKRVASWRHEIGAKASSEMTTQFRSLQKRYETHFCGWPIERLRDVVRGSLRTLPSMGF